VQLLLENEKEAVHRGVDYMKLCGPDREVVPAFDHFGRTFGRSERRNLRPVFEIDRNAPSSPRLQRCSHKGLDRTHSVSQAMKDLKVNPEKTSPQLVTI